MTVLFNTLVAGFAGGNHAASPRSAGDQKPDATDEFLKFMHQSPQERLRDLILRSLGITEEQLKRMPPDERMKTERKIAELMRDHTQRKIEEKAAEASDRG